jgi:O-antigen ligase
VTDRLALSAGAEEVRLRGRGWDLLIVSLCVYMLTSVARLHQLFPVLSLVRPVAVAGLLAIGLFLLDRVPRRRIGPLQLRGTRYLLALLVWMALSVPAALWPGGAFVTFVDFLKTVLISLVIIGAVRSVRDVERLTLIYFIGAVIFAAVVLSRMKFQLAVEGRMERLYFYDSNDFATYAITAMPLGLYFAASERRFWLRCLAWGGMALLAAGFIWSGSRGGFLAFMAVIAYFLLRYTSVKRSWRWSAVAVIAVLVTCIAGDAYWERINTVLRPTQDYNMTDDQGRMHLWRRGVGYMIDHPVLGVGAGNFPRAEGTISPLVGRMPRGRSVKWGPPHNSYLQVGTELGVVGLLVFVALLFHVFRALGAVRSAAGPPAPLSREATRLAQSLTASLIGFVVGSFFLTLAYHDIVYTLMGLALGLRLVTLNARAPLHDYDFVSDNMRLLDTGRSVQNRARSRSPLRRKSSSICDGITG